MAATQAAHPAVSLGSTFAGAVTSPVNKILPSGATSTLGKVAQGVAGGALIGGANAAGNTHVAPGASAPNAISQYIANTGTGAGAGALAGGVVGMIPPAARGAAKLVSRIPGVGALSEAVAPAVDPIVSLLRRLSGFSAPSETAPISSPSASKLSGAIAAGGSSPADLAVNPPNMLADVVPDFTRAVRTAGLGPARQTIDDALQTRAARQVPTIQDALEAALGVPRGSASQASATIVAQRAADAAPAYARAYAAPDITDPGILATLRKPDFQKAYSLAQRIGETEGTPIPDIPTGAVPMPDAIAGNPDAEAAFRAAYLKQNPDALGGVSVRTLDLVKRGMNDVISSQYRNGSTALATANKTALQNMLARADQVSPDFAAARQQFAGHSDLLDAATAGRAAMGPSVAAADVTHQLSGLSPGEAALYRSSAADALLSKVEAARGSATGRGDIAGRVFDSIGGQAKLQALFPSNAAFDDFAAKMGDLSDQAATRNIVTGGSNTVDKAAGVAALGGGGAPVNVGDLARMVIDPRYGAARLAGHLANRGAGSIASGAIQRTAADLAPHLVQTGPDLQELLGALDAHSRDATTAAAWRRAATAGAAVSALPVIYGLMAPGTP